MPACEDRLQVTSALGIRLLPAVGARPDTRVTVYSFLSSCGAACFCEPGNTVLYVFSYLDGREVVSGGLNVCIFQEVTRV